MARFLRVVSVRSKLVGSRAWQRSHAQLEALLQSTVRCIEHYRKLEDSEKSRAACLAFLQSRLIFFYPDSPHIEKQMCALAKELDGAISPPTLTWKYRYIKAAVGLPVAKRCKIVLPGLRHRVEQSWDHVNARHANFGKFDYFIDLLHHPDQFD